jgi:hypothetical protein
MLWMFLGKTLASISQVETVSSGKQSDRVALSLCIGNYHFLADLFSSYAGVSRSAACVIAYLMQDHGMGMF